MDTNGTRIPLDYSQSRHHDIYILPTFELDHGLLLFSTLASFVTNLIPNDIPIEKCILDLLEKTLQSNEFVKDFLYEALHVESGFICLIILLLIVSLLPLIYLFGWHRCNNTRSPSPVENSMTALELSLNETSSQHRNKFLLVLLQLTILVLFGGIIIILIGNYQIHESIERTPDVVDASIHDIEQFVNEAHNQITFNIHNGYKEVINRIKSDLEDIDKLLGDRIMKEVSRKTGITDAFTEIEFLTSVNDEIIQRVGFLEVTVQKVLNISKEADQRIEELAVQLSVLQKQCTQRDRPLCDTLHLKNFKEFKFMDILKKMANDKCLHSMTSLGETELDKERINISTELATIRKQFRDFPHEIKKETSVKIDEVIKQLMFVDDKAQISTRVLTSTKKTLLTRLNNVPGHVESILSTTYTIGKLIWTLTVAVIILLVLLFILYTLALHHGYNNANIKARLLLVSGALITSVISILVAFYAIFIFILAGHGDMFLCRTFYESPNYTIMTKLFDKPGLVYKKPIEINGILNNLFQQLDAVGEYTILNRSLADALNSCERNESTFKTFQLNNLVDLSQLNGMNDYPQLKYTIENISVTTNFLVNFTRPLQYIFEAMLDNSDINLTKYRMELGKAPPDRELTSFLDQTQRVSLQIDDVATVSRITTLASRVKRFQYGLIDTIEKLRNDILFQLSALELQLMPWRLKVNQTLITLKMTQFVVNYQSNNMCWNHTRDYQERLKGYIALNTRNLRQSLGNDIASCRPLFDVFNANRGQLCRQIIDPLNCLWFITSMCLVLFIIIIRLTLGLANLFQKQIIINQLRNLGRRNSTNLNGSLERNRWTSGRNHRVTPVNSPRRNHVTTPVTSPRHIIPRISAPHVIRRGTVQEERMELDDVPQDRHLYFDVDDSESNNSAETARCQDESSNSKPGRFL